MSRSAFVLPIVALLLVAAQSRVWAQSIATAFTTQPASGTTTVIRSYQLSASAVGQGGVSYQWYQGASGDTSHPMGTAASSANTYQTPALAANTQYWVRATALTGGQSADSDTATVTVQPLTIINSLGSIGLISNSGGISLRAVIPDQNADVQLPGQWTPFPNFQYIPAVTYQWQRDGVNIPNASSLQTQNEYIIGMVSVGGLYRLSAATAMGTFYSNAIPLVTVTTPPNPTPPAPPNNQFKAGSDAALDVNASGYKLSYQWTTAGGISLTDGSKFSGTQTRTLTISHITPADAMEYQCKIYSDGVYVGATTANVTVVSPPVFTTQPASGTTTVIRSYWLNATATAPGGVTYQWYQGASGDTSHPLATIFGSINYYYAPSLATTTQYWVRATALSGGLTTDSNTATVTVQPLTITGGGPAGSHLIANSDYVSLTSVIPDPNADPQLPNEVLPYPLIGSIPAVTYQWQRNEVDIANTLSLQTLGENLSGTISVGGLYRLVATTATGTFYSNAIPLVTISLPSPPPSNQFNEGVDAHLDVNASGFNLSYQWVGSGGTPLSEGNKFSTTQTRTLTISHITPADAIEYQCKIYSDGVYVGASSVKPTVIPAPPPIVITKDLADVTTSLGGTASLQFEAAGTGPLTYEWYSVSDQGVRTALLAPLGGFTNTLVLTGVMSSARYQADVSSGQNIIATRIATVTVNPVSITGVGLVKLGQNAQFDVVGLGNLAATIQWQKDGVPVPGASGPHLSFRITNPSAAGEYRALISFGAGTPPVATTSKVLVVLGSVGVNGTSYIYSLPYGSDANMSVEASGPGLTFEWSLAFGRPLPKDARYSGMLTQTLHLTQCTPVDAITYVCKISSNGVVAGEIGIPLYVANKVYTAFTQSPSSQTVYPNQTTQLSAVAVGQGQISYQWFKGLSGDTSHPVASVATGYYEGTSFTVTPITSSVSYWVRATSDSGQADSETATLTFAPKMVPVFYPGDEWLLYAPITGQVYAEGATFYAVEGLPPGVTLDKTNGAIRGSPTRTGTYQLRITARSIIATSDVLTQTVTVKSLKPNVVGDFVGLVDRDVSLNNALGGKIRFTVTSSGAYSGSFSLGGVVHPFTGRFTSTEADGSVNIIGGVKTLTRLPQMYFGISLSASASIATGYIGGVSTEGSIPAISFIVRKNTWKGSKEKPTAYAGAYTAALKRPDYLTGNADYPQGTGTLMSAVATSGDVLMVARMADNSVVTMSSIFGEDHTIPLHLLLYGGTGSAQGWQTISDDAKYGAVMDGTVGWVKTAQPAKSTTRSYKNGFGLHDLTLVGSKLVVPPAGKIELDLPDNPGNALATFSQGGLANEHNEVFQISPTNKALFQPGAFISMTIDKAIGRFSGGYYTYGIVAPYYGVFVPRLGVGLGSLLLPQGRAPTSPILSGSVVVGAAK